MVRLSYKKSYSCSFLGVLAKGLDSMIRFEKVTKKYPDGTVAVAGIDLEIKKGEFFVLIGPSGSGKTTALKMINQLIPQTEGAIYIGGKEVKDYDIFQLRWNIGYVLQQIALFPHMTVEENIAVVPEMKKWSKDEMKQRARELLEMVGMDPSVYASRKPRELSGGQQQRIGVIRALAADPDILLMDEPFSALDPISREKLQDDMLRLKRDLQKTTVFVTHDRREALKLADRICLMREGRVVQIGTPKELLEQPADAFVREFLGQEGSSSFHLDEISMSLAGRDVSHLPRISCSASLEETVALLAERDEAAVEQDGTAIGIVNRQSLLQYLADTAKREVR